MKLSEINLTPHGIARVWFAHLRAGYRLCKATGKSLLSLRPDYTTSMTPAWNVYQTLHEKKLPLPKTIIDIGANVSQMTKLLLYFSKDARVISFEPNPALTPIGEVKRLALSDFNGKRDFFVPRGYTLTGSLKKDRNAINVESFPVQVRRMDTLIEKGKIKWKELERPIMVKIDSERSDKQVIDGFGKYLKDVDYLLVEVENSYQDESYNLMSISRAIAKHTFSQCKIVWSCFCGPDAPTYSDILFWRMP